jgi:hypothetical protein
VLFAAVISTGLRPSCAVIFCKLPKSTFESCRACQRNAQPSEERREERIQDTRAREGETERRVRAPIARDESSESMNAIVRRDHRIRIRVIRTICRRCAWESGDR